MKLIALLAVSLLAATVHAADKAHDDMTIKVKIDSYSFVPVQKDYLVDQAVVRPVAETIRLKNVKGGEDHLPKLRAGFRDSIPQWEGSKDITLKHGYHVTIKAVYMAGRPMGDFVEPETGLSINVSYYHDKQLIGFQSATSWKKNGTPAVSISVLDIAYLDLMSRNSLEVPTEVEGYSADFRLWVAARGVLAKRGKKSEFDALAGLLGPLGRKDNLMIPVVTIECKPAGAEGAEPEPRAPRL